MGCEGMTPAVCPEQLGECCTPYSGRGDWGTTERVRKQEFCCRHYNFEMHARHPKGAAGEAVEFTGVLLGCLEVIGIQMTFKGMDWVIADRGSEE